MLDGQDILGLFFVPPPDQLEETPRQTKQQRLYLTMNQPPKGESLNCRDRQEHATIGREEGKGGETEKYYNCNPRVHNSTATSKTYGILYLLSSL